MSVSDTVTSRDAALEEAFGATLEELYVRATLTEANAPLQRALQLRSSLADAEELVARVRDRVHDATATDLDMGGLSAPDLRWDADWLEAALTSRHGYAVALDELLRTMPPLSQPNTPRAELTPKTTATAPPAPRAWQVRTRHP